MPQARRLLLSPWGALTLALLALAVTITASVTSAREYFNSRSTSFAATTQSPTGVDTLQAAPQRWDTALQEAGGVSMTVTSSRGFTWMLSGTPTGDRRVLTGDNHSPEWWFTSGGNYARLGVEELLANRSNLAALQKSTASWTDAARDTNMWRTRASTIDIGAGIQELNSIADPVLTRDPGISWTATCKEWATTRWALWEPYGDICSVNITLTRDGVPSQVRSSDAIHHATWTITEWGPINTPDLSPSQIITLDDIRRLTSNTSTPLNGGTVASPDSQQSPEVAETAP